MDQAGTREHEIARRSAQVIRTFPALWRQMVDEWGQPAGVPRAWLMYSASYLMQTGEVRWAIDPVRLEHRLPSARSVDYAADLSALSLVLLTHQHGDHLDIKLIRSLKNFSIMWVVPEPLLRRVTEEAGIAIKHIIVSEALRPIEFGGLRITPFNGMHWEESQESPAAPLRGVPAMGYFVESACGRWLFPGDTRTYDAKALPSFGPIDMLFAHIWLGRAAAQVDPPPHLESFCRWCLDLHARRIVLTHLEEFGREPDDFWNLDHAMLVAARLRQLQPTIDAVIPTLGQSIRL